jgi:hypothetical protein
MDLAVACGAQGDQVFFGIAAPVAAELSVMNIQIGH